MTTLPLVALSLWCVLAVVLTVVAARQQRTERQKHQRLEDRFTKLEQSKSADPPAPPAPEIKSTIGSVGYVSSIDLEWSNQDGLDEVRVKCWFAAHAVGDTAATFPKKLACWIGRRMADGELCELKPLSDPTYSNTGRWQHRLYEGCIIPYQSKARLWLAIQEGMRLDKRTAVQPETGAVFAAVAVRLLPEEGDPARSRLSLSPAGMMQSVGYLFLVQIANWNGVPKGWRIEDSSQAV